MSIFNDIARKIKKAFDRRKNKGRKRGPNFTTTSSPKSTTVSTMLVSTMTVTTTTMENSNNVTDMSGAIATVGRARLSGEMELLSLTEIMAIVSGVVGLIILSTLVCFVYRTKCRKEVSMRKTGVGERRSGAMSLDMMELYENDQRQTARDRLMPAFNSPMYGHTEESDDVLRSTPNGTHRELSDGNTEDGGYYSVAMNDSSELCVSYTNIHDGGNLTNNLSGRYLESFKGKKVNINHEMPELDNNATAHPKSKKSKHTYENVNKDKNTESRHKEKSVKDNGVVESKEKKHTYANVHSKGDNLSTDTIHMKKEQNTDEMLDNFHEVESIDLSSPPTPCSHGSYVNVSTGDDIPELNGVKHGYINTDFREQNMPLLEQIEDKDNSKRKKDNLKNRKDSSNKQVLPFETVSPSIPINTEEGGDYLPMNSPTMVDIDYVPMDCNEDNDEYVVEELVADNVYIYMDTNSPTAEYMNYKAVNSNYENV